MLNKPLSLNILKTKQQLLFDYNTKCLPFVQTC